MVHDRDRVIPDCLRNVTESPYRGGELGGKAPLTASNGAGGYAEEQGALVIRRAVHGVPQKSSRSQPRRGARSGRTPTAVPQKMLRFLRYRETAARAASSAMTANAITRLPACSRRHAAHDTRASTRRSRRQAAIRSVIATLIPCPAGRCSAKLNGLSCFLAPLLLAPLDSRSSAELKDLGIELKDAHPG
jgi:hypothetical protein